MKFLKQIATGEGVWKKGTFLARVCVEDELFEEFIAYEKIRNPTVEYIEEEFKNKYHRANTIPHYRDVWRKNNKGNFRLYRIQSGRFC